MSKLPAILDCFQYTCLSHKRGEAFYQCNGHYETYQTKLTKCCLVSQ